MLSAGPSWQGSARQTLRNARAEYNLQKVADKMFRRQGEVRERRRYERLYERNSSNRTMTPRSLNDLIPGLSEMQEALYPGLPGLGTIGQLGGFSVFIAPSQINLPGWINMRNVARRTIFRLRVWIRRMLRRFADLPLLVINPDGQYFGLAIPRLFRFQQGGLTIFEVKSNYWGTVAPAR